MTFYFLSKNKIKNLVKKSKLNLKKRGLIKFFKIKMVINFNNIEKLN